MIDRSITAPGWDDAAFYGDDEGVGGGGGQSSTDAAATRDATRERQPDEADDEEEEEEERIRVLDFHPDDDRYRCACRTIHTVTGVRVIAFLLCATALLELWTFCVTAYTAAHGAQTEVQMAFFRMLVGVLIAASVIFALWQEKAAYLVPYMLLQVTGLAAASVFFVAFVYIALFGDAETALAFFNGRGFPFGIDIKQNGIDSAAQPIFINYESWLMVGSCGIMIAVQLWLITIVFGCWRYFRDKRASMRSKHLAYGRCRYIPPSQKSRMAETSCGDVTIGGVSTLRQSVSFDDTLMPAANRRAVASAVFAARTLSTSLDAMDLPV